MAEQARRAVEIGEDADAPGYLRAIEARLAELPATRPVKEPNGVRLIRDKRGYKVVTDPVDAAALKRVFEGQSGEVLPYKPERLARIRAREHDNSYVEVDVESGQVHINDGRHRLAVAAERGQKMPVVVKSDEGAGELRELLAATPAPTEPEAPAPPTPPAAAPTLTPDESSFIEAYRAESARRTAENERTERLIKRPGTIDTENIPIEHSALLRASGARTLRKADSARAKAQQTARQLVDRGLAELGRTDEGETIRLTEAPVPPTPEPRVEQTAMGQQALIPGAGDREVPTAAIRPRRPQRGTEGTPLFEQPREGEAEQGALFMRAEPPEAERRRPTDTPAFREWFGPSFVEDTRTGEPKVVYHGTGAPGFAAFARMRLDPDALYGKGIYMTEDPDLASTYAGKGYRRSEPLSDEARAAMLDEIERDPHVQRILSEPGYLSQSEIDEVRRRLDQARDSIRVPTMFLDSLRSLAGQPYNARAVPAILQRHLGTGGVYPLYASIKNPFLADEALDHDAFDNLVYGVRKVAGAKTAAEFERQFADEMRGDGIFESEEEAWMLGAPQADQVIKLLRDMLPQPHRDLAEILKAAGYDGVQYTGGRLTGGKLHTVWVAFDPAQVKSAIANVGTYSPKTADIATMRAMPPEEGQPLFASTRGDQARRAGEARRTGARPVAPMQQEQPEPVSADALRREVETSPEIPGTDYRLVNTTPAGLFGTDLLEDLRGAPEYAELAGVLGRTFQAIRDRLGDFDADFLDSSFAGLATDMRYRGATAPTAPHVMVLNPWTVAEAVVRDFARAAVTVHEVPRQIAQRLVSVAKHELTHARSGPHDELFAFEFTELDGRIMQEAVRAVDEIQAALEANDGAGWQRLLDDAVRLRARQPYQERHRPESGRLSRGARGDAADRASLSASEPPRGEGRAPLGPGGGLRPEGPLRGRAAEPGQSGRAPAPGVGARGPQPGAERARNADRQRGAAEPVVPTDARILANRVELFFPPDQVLTAIDVALLFEQAPVRIAPAPPVEGRGARWVATFPDRYEAVEEFDRLLQSGMLSARRPTDRDIPTVDTRRRPRIQGERGAPIQETAATQPNWQPPARADGQMDLKNKYRLIRQLEDALGVPIRTGKVRVPGARGIFKVEPEVIRLRNAANLPTALHEIGHFLRKKRLVDYSEFEEPLEALAERRGLKGDPFEEGIAEFTKLYVTEPTQAESAIPGLVDRLEEGLRRRWPEGLEALLRVRQQYRDLRDAPLLARIQANTESGRSQRGAHLTARSFREWLHRFYAGSFDDLHIVKKIQEAATGARRLAADEDAYIVARLSRSPSAAEMFLRTAPVDFDTLTPRPDILPFEKAIKPVWKDRDRFDAYLQLRTTIDMLDSGVERLERAGQRMLAAWETNRAGLDELHEQLATPEFREAARNLDRLREALLDYVGASGRYSEGQLALLRRLHQHHAPLYRVFDEGPDTPFAAGVGPDRFANLPSPIKRRTGSERPVISPLQSIVRNIYAMVTVANRNEVMATLANHVEGADGLGRLMERVPPDQKPTVFPLEEIRAALEEAGLELDEADLGTLARVFRPTRSQDPNVVTIYRNGQAEEWLVDPSLAKVAANLDHWTLPWWLKFFVLVKNVMRAGVVLHPQFMAANVVRDQLASAAQSRFAIPFEGFARGFARLVGGGEIWQRYQASGAPVFSQLLAEPEAVEAMMRRDIGRFTPPGESRALFTKLYDVVMDGYNKVGRVTEFSEAPTRLGVFERRLARPEPEDIESRRPERARALRAGYEAREASVDFSRRGGWGGIRGWTAITDFMNPAMQGGDKFFRTAKDHPLRTAAVAAGLMLASLLLYLNNRDKEAYKYTSQAERDLNFIYAPDDGSAPIKIPGGFEWMIFAALPRRIMEWLDGEDPELVSRLGESFGRLFGVNWIPTAVRPLIENYANWSFFRDRPLEPRGMERLPHGQRFSSRTSEVAKEIGELLDVGPEKIDNLIRGYTGTIGEDLVKAIDPLLRTEERGEPPTRRWGDLPVLRRFIARTPNLSVAAVGRFYDLLETSQQAEADRNRRKTEGRLTREFDQDHAVHFAIGGPFGKSAVRFATWRRLMTQIDGDPTLSGDEKRRRIDHLTRAIVQEAEARVRGADQLREQLERKRAGAPR